MADEVTNMWEVCDECYFCHIEEWIDERTHWCMCPNRSCVPTEDCEYYEEGEPTIEFN